MSEKKYQSHNQTNMIASLVLSLAIIFLYQNCGVQRPVAENSSAASQFNHSMVAAERCSLCHEKDRPLNSAIHDTDKDCKSCHSSSEVWDNAQAHSPQPTSCASCHGEGRTYDSFPADHLNVYNTDCIECHTETLNNFRSWTVANYQHKPIPQECASCHGVNQKYASYPANHIDSGNNDCIECHLANTQIFQGWKLAEFSHSPVPSQCNDCHGTGQRYDAFPATHFDVGNVDCLDCHNKSTSSFTNWLGAVYTHNPVPGQCSVCHGDNQKYDSYPADHVATGNQDCLTCHENSVVTEFQNWTAGIYLHPPQADTCSSCHATGQKYNRFPNGHLEVGSSDCLGCHQATLPNYVDWKGGVYGHSPIPSSCNSCHSDNQKYDSFPIGHLNTDGADCITCHQASMFTFSFWSGATYSHKPTPTSCSSCHGDNQKYDSFQAGVHTEIGATDCIQCHQSSMQNYSQWTSATYVHSPSTTSCNSCHGDNQTQDRFPAGHIDIANGDCVDCHQSSQQNYDNWKGAIYNHSPLPTQCATCHGDGQTRDSFPVGHLPTTGSDCIECHQASTATFVNWLGGAFTHNPQPLECNSCHADNQQYDRFPADHVPAGNSDCIDCHQPSTVNFDNWLGANFNHTSAIINQKNCNSCHSDERPNTGQFMDEENVKNHYGTVDCSVCHRTDQQFRSWRSGNTSHYNASGTKIESCLPCHNRDKAPDENDGKVLTESPSDQHQVLPHPNYNLQTNELGRCYSCHNKGRRSFSE